MGSYYAGNLPAYYQNEECTLQQMFGPANLKMVWLGFLVRVECVCCLGGIADRLHGKHSGHY